MLNNNFSLLSAMAYANFSNINIKDVTIVRDKLLSQYITREQAKNFTDNYDILAHQSNTASGYSGSIGFNGAGSSFRGAYREPLYERVL